MRWGVLGGTFDPIHLGHLDVAEAARAVLGLTRVWVAPARQPPHRSVPGASAAHRFAMVALGLQDRPWLDLTDVEMDAPGPSYTSALFDRLAASRDLSTGVFITGADAFADIGTWHDYPAILDRMAFAVVSRPGAPASGLPRLLPALAHRMAAAPSTSPVVPSIFLVDVPTSPVSSTEVRARVAAGRSIRDMVPGPVADYIERQRLYTPTSKGHS
jgi:nicotinate-nucleotide adenylyltransferase